MGKRVDRRKYNVLQTVHTDPRCQGCPIANRCLKLDTLLCIPSGIIKIDPEKLPSDHDIPKAPDHPGLELDED